MSIGSKELGLRFFRDRLLKGVSSLWKIVLSGSECFLAAAVLAGRYYSAFYWYTLNIPWA